MKVELKKKNDPVFTATGAAVLYKNFIEFSETDDFDTLLKVLIKKHKMNASETMAKAVQLNYRVDKSADIIYIVLNRTLVDANNFSENVSQYINTIRGKIGKERGL